MVSSGAAQACLLVLLCSGSAMAKMSRWERVLQAGADATVSQEPAVAPAAAVDSGPLVSTSLTRHLYPVCVCTSVWYLRLRSRIRL